ncbi:MAG: dicarboxylate/amino acid:cation symporter [Verrucomicrobia bacterium]|nr:dicarboxylate/amino acid:cation symporter [Verrucomicrobiota bacterium]
MSQQAVSQSDRLATRIMWGMAAGIVVGILARLAGGRAEWLARGSAWLAAEVFDPFGQIFLRLLFFVVIPLIFSSLVLGVIQLGRLDRLGPLAARTFAVFFLNMSVGLAIGLFLMNTVQPGRSISEEVQAQLVSQAANQAQEVQARAAAMPRLSFRELVEMFMPRNLLKAVVEFQILPLILFAILLGAAGTQLDELRRRQTQSAVEIVTGLMTTLVHFAMLLAPWAVAAMLASQVMRAGLDVLKALSLFVACVLGGLALHLFGTMTLLLKLFTRRSPGAFFRAIRTVLVTAFSTSSSNATLPTTIAVTRENLGVSASTAGFVLPLGATMNMSGTALYEGCVVLFVAQVYGVSLSLGDQVTLLLLTVLSAVAVAGIPGASLPLIVALLTTFRIPPEGIALILGADRLLDMARTVVNVGADVVTACIVDEGIKTEETRDADQPVRGKSR